MLGPNQRQTALIPILIWIVAITVASAPVGILEAVLADTPAGPTIRIIAVIAPAILAATFFGDLERNIEGSKRRRLITIALALLAAISLGDLAISATNNSVNRLDQKRRELLDQTAATALEFASLSSTDRRLAVRSTST